MTTPDDADVPDLVPVYEKELSNIFEFMFLVAFPAKEEFGFETALTLVKKWPRMRPRWRRLRRRVCDYCGRRNELSEPRLWICGGCGVARYCDKECQANDFSHHAKCCPVLARRWDGAGSMPLKLFDLFAEGKWKDPAVLPSARARERVREMDEGMDRFIDEYASEEGERW